MINFDNQRQPYRVLQKLPEDDISQRFYKGEKFVNNGVFAYITGLFDIENKINTLHKFYPYHPAVKSNYQSYYQHKKWAIDTGLTISAASWFLIYQFARRGRIAPVLRQYGSFFKTHRIFRQYVYTLFVPTLALVTLNQDHYLNNTNYLWLIHSQRLNQKILDDPFNCEYPLEVKQQREDVRIVSTFRDLAVQLQQQRLSKLSLEELPEVILPNDSQSQEGGSEESEGASEAASQGASEGGSEEASQGAPAQSQSSQGEQNKQSAPVESKQQDE